jgi:hypothetical protein
LPVPNYSQCLKCFYAFLLWFALFKIFLKFKIKYMRIILFRFLLLFSYFISLLNRLVEIRLIQASRHRYIIYIYSDHIHNHIHDYSTKVFICFLEKLWSDQNIQLLIYHNPSNSSIYQIPIDQFTWQWAFCEIQQQSSSLPFSFYESIIYKQNFNYCTFFLQKKL